MSNVDLEKFVREWQTAESVTDVADAMGMSKLGASVKASHLRKNGVPLKKFRTGIGTDPSEFVKIWNEASSLDEAAETLGIRKSSASMRASHLRKLGEPIKRFPRGRQPGKSAAATAELAALAMSLVDTGASRVDRD